MVFLLVFLLYGEVSILSIVWVFTFLLVCLFISCLNSTGFRSDQFACLTMGTGNLVKDWRSLILNILLVCFSCLKSVEAEPPSKLLQPFFCCLFVQLRSLSLSTLSTTLCQKQFHALNWFYVSLLLCLTLVLGFLLFFFWSK